jgi:hypothetical protein
MRHSTGQFTALDDSIADTVKQAQLNLKIYARTRELFGADGSAYGYSFEKAREQATLDVTGEFATDDVEVAKSKSTESS